MKIFVMMFGRVTITVALASLAAGIPSPKSLKTDITILINNDLQGKTGASEELKKHR